MFIYMTTFLCAQFVAPVISSAEVMEGQAAIIDGNIEKARSDARKDAMRNFIEKEVGVHISSSTEVAEGMVVRDHIIANSDGYVQVNRVVKEWQSGNIYCVSLDLQANAQKFETAVTDLKSALQSMDTNSNRYGIQLAVTGRDETGKAKKIMPIMRYVQQNLENIGFDVYPNDTVLAYMDSNLDLDTPKANADIRRIARDNREEGNALLRGTLSTISVSRDGEYAQATVQASFELIGLDSSAANTFSDFFTAAGKTKEDALRKAEEQATQKAIEALGQKALRTVQNEYRGGVHHIKMTAVFSGITDRASQGNSIIQGLSAAKCRIIRQSYASDGTFRVFFEAASYDTTAELQNAILQNIPGLVIGNTNEADYGSTKLYFSL